MTKLKNEEIINAVKEMTILELKELVDLIKEEFGVDPSAVAATPVAEVTEEKAATVTIELKEAGANKFAVIKIVREVTGLGLKEAKDITDNGGVIKENIASEEADQLKIKFEEAGAVVELK